MHRRWQSTAPLVSLLLGLSDAPQSAHLLLLLGHHAEQFMCLVTPPTGSLAINLHPQESCFSLFKSLPVAQGMPPVQLQSLCPCVSLMCPLLLAAPLPVLIRLSTIHCPLSAAQEMVMHRAYHSWIKGIQHYNM